MAKFTDQEYAEYMLANYVLGYIDTSIFIAANLFDKYFYESISTSEIKKLKARTKKKHLGLPEYFNLYFEKDYDKQDVLYGKTDNLRGKLDSFRELRNDFIHGMDDTKILENRTKIGEYILYVYFSFHVDLKYDSTIINDESTNNLMLQDYKIKEITERMIDRLEKQKISLTSNAVKQFPGIDKNDFFNLFELRKKLRYLQRALTRETENIGLVPTILSPIDTTSAYIWMPFVDQDFTDNKNKHNTKRNNLTMGSVSILTTPLDFRIYIDFGGGDFEYRMAFQEFLSQQSTIEYLVELINSEEASLSIFDIRWYSFIVRQQNLLDVVKKNQLKYLVEEAVEAIQSEEDSHQIITSGYNRIGFIIPASNIDKNTILRLFKKIAHFYYEFLKYKFKDDPDVNMLSESQKMLKISIK